MMGEIYSKCQRVYIWLGVPDFPHCDETQPAVNPFEFVEHFADDRHYSELPGYFVSPSGDTAFDHNDNGFQRRWEGFDAVLNSPWWTRLWCVQEVLLPPQALMLLGRWSISWQRFGNAAMNQSRHRMTCCSQLVQTVAAHFRLHLDNLVLDAPRQAKFSLDYMLRGYRYKQCHDPSDKVFGLLGVSEMQKAPKLQPDYSLPPHIVLIKAMETIILEAECDLLCLTGTGFNSARRGLPT
jgi:hypothetical protein